MNPLETLNSTPIYKKQHLEDFHIAYKYMFMMYSPKRLKTLGTILSQKQDLEEILKQYKEELEKLLLEQRSTGKDINALEHLYGYFKQDVTIEERNSFYHLIDQYRDGVGSLDDVVLMLSVFQKQYPKVYLSTQVLLKKRGS